MDSGSLSTEGLNKAPALSGTRQRCAGQGSQPHSARLRVRRRALSRRRSSASCPRAIGARSSVESYCDQSLMTPTGCPASATLPSAVTRSSNDSESTVTLNSSSAHSGRSLVLSTICAAALSPSFPKDCRHCRSRSCRRSTRVPSGWACPRSIRPLPPRSP